MTQPDSNYPGSHYWGSTTGRHAAAELPYNGPARYEDGSFKPLGESDIHGDGQPDDLGRHVSAAAGRQPDPIVASASTMAEDASATQQGTLWTPEHDVQHRDHATPETRDDAASSGMAGLPKFALLCPTYCRPENLKNLVACFEALDYPLRLRQLIVLDDADQYPQGFSGPGWEIVSLKRRFRTLSQKRNTLAALADRDTDVFCAWDDDDSWTPWTLLAHAAALESAKVSHPGWIFTEPTGTVTGHTASGQHVVGTLTPTMGMFQATQAIDANTFWAVNGYPLGNSGVDQKLMSNLRKFGATHADPIDAYPPFFFYGWENTNAPHLSSLGREGYDGVEFAKQREGRFQIGAGTFTPKQRRDWAAIGRRTVGYAFDADHYSMRSWWSEHRAEVLKA